MTDITQLSFSELKTWLRDRLHSRGLAGSEIDIRKEESPYERPVAEFRSGPDRFRAEFIRAIKDLIAESFATPWHPDAFHQLMLLLDEADLYEAVDALEDAIRSVGLLSKEAGLQLHMLALRTLLSIGWVGTPDFWISRERVSDGKWSGVIFDGLAQHDLTLAFSRLPRLARDAPQMRDVLDLFPAVLQRSPGGIGKMNELASKTVDHLAEDAALLLRAWFERQGFPIAHGTSEFFVTNVTLIGGIGRILGGDVQPRSNRPKLY